jgi:hypothetical protein
MCHTEWQGHPGALQELSGAIAGASLSYSQPQSIQRRMASGSRTSVIRPHLDNSSWIKSTPDAEGEAPAPGVGAHMLEVPHWGRP